MLTAQKALENARSQNGYVEGSGNKTPFGKWYGMDGQPWCAMFVSWSCYDFDKRESPAPATISKGYASCAAGKRWFQEQKRWGSEPKVGAHGMLYYSSLNRVGHVFIVEKIDPPYVITWEGNTDYAGGRTGGRVMQKQRRISDINGFGYPFYATATQPKPPQEGDWFDMRTDAEILALIEKGTRNALPDWQEGQPLVITSLVDTYSLVVPSGWLCWLTTAGHAEVEYGWTALRKDGGVGTWSFTEKAQLDSGGVLIGPPNGQHVLILRKTQGTGVTVQTFAPGKR